MGNFLDTIYDVLFQPRKAMQVIAENRLWGQALFLFFISAMMPPWAFKSMAAGIFPVPLAGAALAVEFTGFVAFWFLASAILGIVAEMFGGRGSALGLFAALGFCALPRIVVIPLWAVVSFLPPGIKAVFTGIIGAAVLVWVFYLGVAALAASYRISLAKAVAVMFFPLVIIILSVIIFAVFTGAALTAWQ